MFKFIYMAALNTYLNIYAKLCLQEKSPTCKCRMSRCQSVHQNISCEVMNVKTKGCPIGDASECRREEQKAKVESTNHGTQMFAKYMLAILN